jgi:cell division protein FtsB
MLFSLAVLCIIFRYPNFGGKLHRRASRERDEALESARRENTQLKRELEQLEERIRVLERIVTNDPNDLRRQFRDLGS